MLYHTIHHIVLYCIGQRRARRVQDGRPHEPRERHRPGRRGHQAPGDRIHRHDLSWS